MKSEIILVFLWLVYGFVHTVLAMNPVKDIFTSFSKYYRLIYNALAILLILPILNYQFSFPSQLLLEKSLLNQILGGLMMTSGLFLTYKALTSYDLSEFIGTQSLQQSSKPSTFKNDELSSVVRHPLYLGMIVFLWGWFGFSGLLSSLVTALTLTIYIRIGIYFEEKKLVEQFGKIYQDYQKKVPMLIPRFEEEK
ncbi:MAG: isoprenylcysteine carboxylmethyltransferase family protein [Arcicella sp.]|nr:isoprenylcysteine carboxylmethyltransferase family protein [Arcicella sp.]